MNFRPIFKSIFNLPCIIIISQIINLSAQISYAQSQSSFRWSIDGNLRYRFEKWDNMNARYYGSDPKIGKPDDYILLQRIIIGTTLHLNNHIRISAHLQDARAFGWSLRNNLEPDAFKVHAQNAPEPYYKMNPHEQFFEIYDLNIQFDSLFNNLSIIFGRQKIAFNDYRMFGPGTWGNSGRWNWDALRINFKRKNWKSSLWIGGTKVNDPERTFIPFTHNEYYGGGFHNELKINKHLISDFYYAHKKQGSADYIRDLSINRNWLGFRLYSPVTSSWIYEISYNHEFGKEDGSGIRAFGTFLKFGYQFNRVKWKPGISFRHTYASGNRPETETIESYDPAYGAMDRYYGWMNIVKWSNLDDWEIMLELYPVRGMRAELKYNIFSIPEPEDVRINGNLLLPQGKDHLGNEIDFLVRYDINESWQLTLLTGYFKLKDAITLTSANPGDAFYISAQACYSFKIKLLNN